MCRGGRKAADGATGAYSEKLNSFEYIVVVAPVTAKLARPLAFTAFSRKKDQATFMATEFKSGAHYSKQGIYSVATIVRHPGVADYIVEMSLDEIAGRPHGISDLFEDGKVIIIKDYRLPFDFAALERPD